MGLADPPHACSPAELQHGHSVQVRPECVGASGAPGSGCEACGVGALVRGLCNSGTYRYIYEVESSDGLTAYTARTVVIWQRTAVQFNVVAAGDQDTIERAKNNATPPVLLEAFAELASAELGLGNINASQVLVVSASEGATAGTVNFTIQILSSPSVSRRSAKDAGMADSAAELLRLDGDPQTVDLSPPVDPVASLMASLEESLGSLANSVAQAGTTLQLLETAAPLALGFAKDRGPATDAFSDLAQDASAHQAYVTDAGLQILDAVNRALQSTRSVAVQGQDLSKELASALVASLAEGALDDLKAAGPILSRSGKCNRGLEGGRYKVEFVADSSTAADVGYLPGRKGRSLLVGGGMSTGGSSASSGTLEFIESQEIRRAAIKASASLRTESWSLIKEYAVNNTVAELDRSNGKDVRAMQGIATGALMHLTRKVAHTATP